MNIRITDKGGLKPTFTQWDVDRVLLISGCESQPSLRFDNPELSRSIVAVAEADGSDWKCNVPNFMLQFSGPMIVSVFIQPDEGKTVFTARYAVQWAKKPQDYTYEENIGYTNWVHKTEEAQELLDDIEDLRDEIQTAVDTATSASEAAVAAAEDIDETVAAALQAAKDSGDFDGADGRDGQDGVSPTVTSESITGGHRLTITDADGVTTVDVMDGQDGQDAVVDPTLTNAGEAADAKATGDELHRHYLELTALSPEIRADTYAWNLRKNYNGSGSYVTADGFGITSNYIPVQPGARVQNTAPEKDGNGKVTAMHINEFSGTTWLRRTILASGKYMSIGADTTSIRIAYGYASNQGVTITRELIDATFSVRIIQQPASGSGGSGITVDDALSGSSTNPVQNKIIKAALDGKYAKPAGGIPASDLAAGVIPTVPSNVSSFTNDAGYLTQHQDISGKLDKAQGVAHAGEFCVVGSDGNITTVTMSVWQGGSF